MSENKAFLTSGIEKKGGYSGTRPASAMPPPPKVPSGFTRPASEPAKPAER
jgi:hypothetical protein